MRDAGTLVLAALLARAAAVALRLIGFAGTRDALAAILPRRVRAVPDPAARAREIGRIVERAASGPLAVSCLPRALVTGAVLAREGIEGSVRLGIRREDGVLHAHAWVEHAGVPLSEPASIASRFAPFERDFGAPAP